MAVFNNILAGASGQTTAEAGPYQIERSLRFNSSDSAYLSRTPASSGSQTTWTWSAWVKFSKPCPSGSYIHLFGAGSSSGAYLYLDLNENQKLTLGTWFTGYFITTRVFRDYSAWMHICLTVETANGTPADRIKLFVNGVRETTFDSSSNPSSGESLQAVNTALTHYISSTGVGGTGNKALDAYLADIHFIDGQALDPTSFTEVDATTGQLVPIEYTGSYGPLVNQSEVWSNALSGSLKTPTAGFDANPYSGRSEGVGGLTFTPATPLVFADKVEVYDNNNVTKSRVNSGSYVQHASNTWVTVASGGGTITTMDFLRTDNPSYDAGFYAIRVDGKLLVDQGITVTSNGFHLPFSDNSTAAALGTDTSGAGNDWDVYNIAPSDGTTYSNNISLSSGTYASGREPAKGFDGLLATVCQGNTNGTSITLSSLVGLTVSTSIEFYSSAGTAGDNTFTINGSSSATMAALNQWTSVSFTGTIASAVISSSAQNPTFSAIRIDGVILVDGAAGDSLVDTPTSYGEDTGAGSEVRGNYATLNPLDKNSSITLLNGNLDFSVSTASYYTARSTIMMTSGKWYYEVNVASASGAIGMSRPGDGLGFLGDTTSKGIGMNTNGYVYDGTTFYSYTPVPTTGDILSVAFDADAGKVWFAVNGTYIASGNPAAGTNPFLTGLTTNNYIPAVCAYNNSATPWSINFGQRPFAYTAPSGYKALCTTNLDDPLVAKPSEVMDVLLWSGTGGNRSFSSLNMSPDFVWIKQRNQAFSTGHQLYDIVRGAGSDKELNSAGTAAEGAGNIDQYGWLSSFDSNGFSVTAGPVGADYVNTSGNTYVAWTWDAGSSTVPNEDGSITSQVRANASAGFSIATYTGNGTAGATIGHGLGAAPDLVIAKRRSSANDWWVYHRSLGGTKYLVLNLTNAAGTANTIWNDTNPSSTVVTLGGGESNTNTATYVAYCFAPVAGYSSFGSYTGNGSADGTFVYTGFRPKYLLLRCSSIVQLWLIYDSERSQYNLVSITNQAHTADREFDSANDYGLDFTSNGFKLRSSTDRTNGSGRTYIYAAFAENPFKYARAR